MNDLITNGEAKTDEPYIPSLERIENKLSYFIGKLVQHHVQKAVEAKFEAVVLVTDQLEGELDDQKTRVQTLEEDLVSTDTVTDLINERLDERDAERNDAEDASEYVKVEDLADAIRDCFHNGEVTFNVDVS
jgi:septal ring factor EnvC (AmiA/AmiB activator)